MSTIEPGDAAAQTDASEKTWPRPWMSGFLVAMGQAPSIARCSRQVGVGRRTVQRWMQKDEDFALAVVDARDDALDTLEYIAFLRGSVGTPVRKTVTRTSPDGKGGQIVETTVTEETHISDSLLMFYLKRWRPEYREAYQVQHTGLGGGPIKHEIYRHPDAERALALARLTLELGPAPEHPDIEQNRDGSA